MIKIDIDIPKLQYVEQQFIIFTIVFMMICNGKPVSLCDFFQTWYSIYYKIFSSCYFIHGYLPFSENNNIPA